MKFVHAVNVDGGATLGNWSLQDYVNFADEYFDRELKKYSYFMKDLDDNWRVLKDDVRKALLALRTFNIMLKYQEYALEGDKIILKRVLKKDFDRVLIRIKNMKKLNLSNFCKRVVDRFTSSTLPTISQVYGLPFIVCDDALIIGGHKGGVLRCLGRKDLDEYVDAVFNWVRFMSVVLYRALKNREFVTRKLLKNMFLVESVYPLPNQWNDDLDYYSEWFKLLMFVRSVSKVKLPSSIVVALNYLLSFKRANIHDSILKSWGYRHLLNMGIEEYYQFNKEFYKVFRKLQERRDARTYGLRLLEPPLEDYTFLHYYYPHEPEKAGKGYGILPEVQRSIESERAIVFEGYEKQPFVIPYETHTLLLSSSPVDYFSRFVGESWLRKKVQFWTEYIDTQK